MYLRELFIGRPWAYLSRQRIFRDRLLRWFVLAAVLICLIELGLLAFRLRPTGFVVPYEYTSNSEFRFGDWRQIFSYGLFSLLVTFGNLALGVMSFEKSRITSFFLIASAIVINAFTLVVTYTLLEQIR